MDDITEIVKKDEINLRHKICCDEASFTECLIRCLDPFIRAFVRAGVVKIIMTLA